MKQHQTEAPSFKATVESRSRATYQRQRRAQSVTLYFRNSQELAGFQRAAQEGGYGNFNAWLLQMLAHATSGAIYPPEYVEGLRKDLERARAWLETSRDENADYRSQVKSLQGQRETLLHVVRRTAGEEEYAQVLTTLQGGL